MRHKTASMVLAAAFACVCFMMVMAPKAPNTIHKFVNARPTVSTTPRSQTSLSESGQSSRMATKPMVPVSGSAPFDSIVAGMVKGHGMVSAGGQSLHR